MEQTVQPTLGEFHYKVLELFDEYDCHDSVFWRCYDEECTFIVGCNDVFWWASGDAETIEPDDLDLLRQSFIDADSADDPWQGPILFVARKRKMRPQGAYFGYKNKDAPVYKLFEDAGPERPIEFLNPYKLYEYGKPREQAKRRGWGWWIWKK